MNHMHMRMHAYANTHMLIGPYTCSLTDCYLSLSLLLYLSLCVSPFLSQYVSLSVSHFRSFTQSLTHISPLSKMWALIQICTGFCVCCKSCILIMTATVFGWIPEGMLWRFSKQAQWWHWLMYAISPSGTWQDIIVFFYSKVAGHCSFKGISMSLSVCVCVWERSSGVADKKSVLQKLEVCSHRSCKVEVRSYALV